MTVCFGAQVLFRSVSKLLMDTATAEYLFCCDFFQEDTIFTELFTAHARGRGVLPRRLHPGARPSAEPLCVIMRPRSSALPGRGHAPSCGSKVHRDIGRPDVIPQSPPCMHNISHPAEPRSHGCSS